MRVSFAICACVLAACSGRETAAPVPAISMEAGGATPTASAEWGCLDHPVMPVARDPQPVTYVVPIVDFDSSPASPISVTDLVVTVCDAAECAATASGVTVDAAPGQPPYVYSVTFPFNFDNGYLRLSAPGYATLDYFLGGPMIGTPDGGREVVGLPIPMLSRATFDRLYRSLQLPLPVDETRGVLAVRALNCLGARAAGVIVEFTREAPDHEGVGWSLSFDNRTTPGASITSERGAAGIAHALPGAVAAHGVAPVGSGAPYGATNLRVRPGVITLVEIRDGLGRWGQ